MATNRQTSDVNSALQQIIQRGDWRAKLVNDYEETAARLQSAYARILPKLRDSSGDLVDRISEWVKANPDDRLTAEYVKGFKQYQDLLARVEVEMQDFANLLKSESGIIEARAIEAGTQSALEMAQAVSGGAAEVVTAAWNRVSPETLQRTIGYVDSKAFRDSLKAFGENAAANVGDVVLAGIAQGKGPLAISSILQNWYALPAAWADSTVRTLQMYSLRGATHESYRQNEDIITGWMWWADLNGACQSCVAMHGTIHPLDEELNDHHNGECTAIPIVKGTTWANDVQSGPDWFAEQSPAYQREILGAGKMELYQNDMFDWNAASKTYENDLYGTMRREATLAELGG